MIDINKKEKYYSSIKVRISTIEEYNNINKILCFKPDLLHVDSYLKGKEGHHKIWIENGYCHRTDGYADIGGRLNRSHHLKGRRLYEVQFNNWILRIRCAEIEIKSYLSK